VYKVNLTFLVFHIAQLGSLDKMGKLTNANLYDSYAYHTALLNDFASDGHSRLHINNPRGNLALSDVGGGILQMTGSNASSAYSTQSFRNRRARSPSRSGRRSSLAGASAFKGRTKNTRTKTLSGGL
jgi:hypothetical protein